jgi:AraC-like DNA-binding protein
MRSHAECARWHFDEAGIRGKNDSDAPSEFISMSELSSSLILPLVHYLRETNCDLSQVFERAGLDERRITDPEYRIPVEKTDALVQAAVEMAGDPALPIRAAQHLQSGDWGVFEYLLRTSADGEELLDKVLRFHKLLADGAVEIIRDEELATLFVFVEDLGQGSTAGAEFSMACWVEFGRCIAGADLTPLRVDFAHPPPGDTREHDRFFNCPILWNAPRYGMHFPFGQEPSQAVVVDRELADFVMARAQRLLENQDQGSTLEAVRSRILAAFRDGNPGLEQIARQMRMSPRTLRRRLEEAGVSFKALRDDLREERACQLLKDPNLAIGEVAHLLGFAETSAFHRAFKRWKGITPAEFRDTAAAS